MEHLLTREHIPGASSDQCQYHDAQANWPRTPSSFRNSARLGVARKSEAGTLDSAKSEARNDSYFLSVTQCCDWLVLLSILRPNHPADLFSKLCVPHPL